MRRKETNVNLNERKEKVELEERSRCQRIYLMLQRAEVRHVQELQVTISVQVNTGEGDKRKTAPREPFKSDLYLKGLIKEKQKSGGSHILHERKWKNDVMTAIRTRLIREIKEKIYQNV